MNVLVITSHFPNEQQSTKGVFIKNQLQKLAGLCRLRVIAPVPWSPPVRIFNKWHIFSRIRHEDNVAGIRVFHPRYLVIPKICRSFYGVLYFLGIYKTVNKILKTFEFDLILTYFAYPDGFASALMAKILKKPLIIKVMGSDINIYTKNKFRKSLTIYSLNSARRIIAVSEDLKMKIHNLGIPLEKITVIKNGVDINKFKPMNKDRCREKLNLLQDSKIILFVGSLRKVKGVENLIQAFSQIKNKNLNQLQLILIGDGELRKPLYKMITQFNLINRITLAGVRDHDEIPFWTNACDILCLPSLAEGCPNVILESLACGKPVIATEVGGITEIMDSDIYGYLVKPDDTDALADAMSKALSNKWNSSLLRRKVIQNTWYDVAEKLFGEISSVTVKK